MKDEAKKSEVKPEDIVAKLKADSNYEVLVRNVDPDVAAGISEKYYGIAADLQDNFAAVRGGLRRSRLGVGGRVGFLGWLTSSLFNRLG